VFGTGRNLTSFNLANPTIEMIAMDVEDETSVTRAIEEILARAGRIDAVINNAGYSLMGAVEDTTIEEAKAQFETNFFGVLRVCRTALPALRTAGGGYIINISSLAGIVGLPYSGLYSATKFALEGVSESLRLEVRQFGIRVVLIEPGDFQTNTTSNRRIVDAAQSSIYKEVFQRTKEKQDKEEMNGPTPEPIARLVGRILNKKQPKTRYSVGRFDQRIVIPLKRLLPQRGFEWLFSLFMGV
jgi:NAD(P)-dependent dehydrogenase (short-subunit alcohol dehydrogenase family)